MVHFSSEKAKAEQQARQAQQEAAEAQQMLRKETVRREELERKVEELARQRQSSLLMSDFSTRKISPSVLANCC